MRLTDSVLCKWILTARQIKSSVLTYSTLTLPVSVCLYLEFVCAFLSVWSNILPAGAARGASGVLSPLAPGVSDGTHHQPITAVPIMRASSHDHAARWSWVMSGTSTEPAQEKNEQLKTRRHSKTWQHKRQPKCKRQSTI